MPALKQTIAARLFDLHDDIRSVMVVDNKGKVTEWVSRTAKPVGPEFLSGLAVTWVSLVGGLVSRLRDFFGDDDYLHIKYKKLHLYGFHYNGGYVVFSTRITHPADMVQKAILGLAN